MQTISNENDVLRSDAILKNQEFSQLKLSLKQAMQSSSSS